MKLWLGPAVTVQIPFFGENEETVAPAEIRRKQERPSGHLMSRLESEYHLHHMNVPPEIVAETLVETLLDLAHQAEVIADGLPSTEDADHVRHLAKRAEEYAKMAASDLILC